MNDSAQKPSSVTPEGSSRSRLVKAAGIVSLMTLSSRILGMIRDILSAKRFGTSWQWDAFIYAFMLPNFLRRIVAEGALTSAFVPVYSDLLEKKGKAEAFRYSSAILTLFGTSLLGLIFILELVFHVLLQCDFLSPRFYLMTDLLRYLFPYLGLISIYAVGMGILNCHHRFVSSSLGPIILDLVWIGAVIWIPSAIGAEHENQIRYLSFWILASGLIQVASQWPSLKQIGFKPEWHWTINDSIKKTGLLLLPGLMNFGVVQINLLVDMTCGLMIGEGANSSLWYGTRLMQFPLGVFAMAMGTALLPAISRETAQGRYESAKKSMGFSLRAVFFIILPCTAGLIALAEPIIRLLFEHGEFDSASTERTARVLICYSLGLFAYSGQKIISTGFYASQDAKTPVKIGAAALVANILLNIPLMFLLAEAGLALATSISAALQFALLMAAYHKKMKGFPFKETVFPFLKTLAASLVMMIFCIFIYGKLGILWGGDSTTHQVLRVFVSIGLSVFVYVFACLLFRVHEMSGAWRWILGSRNVGTVAEETP